MGKIYDLEWDLHPGTLALSVDIQPSELSLIESLHSACTSHLTLFLLQFPNYQINYFVTDDIEININISLLSFLSHLPTLVFSLLCCYSLGFFYFS